MTNPWEIMSAEQARRWDARKSSGLEHFRVSLKRAALWDLIAPHLPADRDRPVLDLGGGTGVWTVRLAQAGCRVVLADISPGLLAAAAEKLRAANLTERVTLLEVDMDDLSRFGDGQFPLILAVGAPLSYCRDAGNAIRAIHRITAPDGVLIGDGENRYDAALFRRRAADWHQAKRVLLEGLSHWPDPANPAPIRLFTPTELHHLLTSAGWQVARLCPSDVVTSLVHQEILETIADDEGAFVEALALERQLREDSHLLTCGRDVQFVARRR